MKSYYAARKLRLSKNKPTDWLIRYERGNYSLDYIGKPENKDT